MLIKLGIVKDIKHIWHTKKIKYLKQLIKKIDKKRKKNFNHNHLFITKQAK